MKKILLSLILVITLFSCSDTEPITFLEKHNLSVWERTEGSDPERKFFLRILSNPDKISDIWFSTVNDCYGNILYGDGFEISIGSNTEDYLEIKQITNYDDQDQISFSIKNGELIQNGYTTNAHGSYNWSDTWVRSEMNVEDLKRCENYP